MTELERLLSGYDACDIRSHVLYYLPQLVQHDKRIRWKTRSRQIHWEDMRHVLFMYSGKVAGWWELSWDLWPERELIDLYPVKLTVVDNSNDEFYTMSQLLVSVGAFKSGKEAKRAGWNKPVEPGDYFFNKKTWVIRVKSG